MLLSLLTIGEIAASAALAGSAAWLFHRSWYVAVPPNKALVLFGGRSRRSTDPRVGRSDGLVARTPRVLVGGGAVLAPWNKAFGYLSLVPIDLEATVRALHSVDGDHAAGWEVTLAVQAKIPAESAALLSAAENLLGMSPEELVAFVRRAVEASVPTVLARIDPGEHEPDWERLATEIQATVGPELIRSGLIVRSVSVRGLRRIEPTTSSVLQSERPRPLPALSPPAHEPDEVDQRLGRIERGLRVMGAEFDRWLQERPARLYGSEPPFDLSLASPSATPADGAVYDSMEDGRSPPPRRPHRAGREDEGGGPPTSSDEKTR
jgi:hypothetical protein